MSQISSLSNTIFTGLGIFIPLLVLLRFNKAFNIRLNITTLIQATNWLLLFAGVIYLLFFASIILPGYIGNYSQDEYWQYSLINRAFGPYWFAYIGYLIIYGLLPQLMWFKKIRQSIVSTITWVFIDYSLSALRFYSIYYNNRDFIPSTPPNYLLIFLSHLMSLIVFLPLLAIVYVFLRAQQKRLLSKHPTSKT
jgi:hypothetical protein